MKIKSCKNYVYVVWKFQTSQHKEYERLDNLNNVVEMTQMRPIYFIGYNKSEVNEYLKNNDYYYLIIKKYYGDLSKLNRR